MDFQLAYELFLGLLNSLMIYLHLLGEVLFKPFILFPLFPDELYCYHTRDKDGTLSDLSVVEPCLDPPLYAVSVRIYGYLACYIKGLDVYVQVFKRVYDSLCFC